MSGKISSLTDKGLFLKNTFCYLAYKMPDEVCAKQFPHEEMFRFDFEGEDGIE